MKEGGSKVPQLLSRTASSLPLEIIQLRIHISGVILVVRGEVAADRQSWSSSGARRSAIGSPWADRDRGRGRSRDPKLTHLLVTAALAVAVALMGVVFKTKAWVDMLAELLALTFRGRPVCVRIVILIGNRSNMLRLLLLLLMLVLGHM